MGGGQKQSGDQGMEGKRRSRAPYRGCFRLGGREVGKARKVRTHAVFAILRGRDGQSAT